MNELIFRGTTNGFGVPFEQDPEEEVPTQEQLIVYGEDTWEVGWSAQCWCRVSDKQAILKYMVSSGLDGGVRAQKPRKEVLQLLHASGLMSDPYVTRVRVIIRADDRYATDQRYSLDRLTITSKGFQFLLEERQTQLWQILIYYLTLQEVRFQAHVRLRKLMTANRSAVRYRTFGLLQPRLHAARHSTR
jgi:transcription initiation factor TFIIH subunit 4